MYIHIFYFFEQTTQETVKFPSFSENNVAEKTPGQRQEFFLFLGCILYTKLVNIITLSGTHIKKEPVWQKESDKGSFSGVCSFLYILDLSTLSQ